MRTNRLKPGGPARIALLIAAALLLTAMAVFFIIGVFESGLDMLFKGNFFTPENLLAWQIPALRGIEVSGDDLESEHNVELDPNLAPEVLEVEAPTLTPEPNGAETEVLKVEVVHLDPAISEDIKIEILGMEKSELTAIDLGGRAPRVLIYHTHTSEAFTQTPANQYAESGQWRTHDNGKNVVALGELLARTLRDEYGFAVIHDPTDHEPPKLGTSYSRSLETMLKYKKQYPTIDMFIDVHRDADLSKGENTDYVVIDGKRVARLMFVVGTGEGKTGVGFKERPNWKENYTLALNITNALNAIEPTLARPIRVKTSRYNQHVSNHAILVEVGHNKNTLEEVLASIPYLAKAVAKATGQGK